MIQSIFFHSLFKYIQFGKTFCVGGISNPLFISK